MQACRHYATVIIIGKKNKQIEIVKHYNHICSVSQLLQCVNYLRF